MSEGSADFVEKRHMKNCKVVLERLDEESLEKCLQKYDLKLAPFFGKHGQTTPGTSKTGTPVKRGRQKRKSSKFSTQRSKRKKMKPFCRTDNENYSNDENLIGKTETAAGDPAGSQVFSNLEESNTPLNKLDATESENVTCETAEKVSPANRHPPETKTPETKVWGKNESIFRQTLLNSFDTRRKTRPDSSDNDGAVEIIQRQPKPGIACGHTDERKSVEVSPIGCLVANSESILKREPAEVEYDSRDDSEDDKNTVIFEEEFQRDTDLDEFFEIEEKDVRKKLSNREITNRKRQRLVKFKRKSMADRNSATLVRAKSKVTEGFGNGREVSEKPIEGVSEESLREVCNLVERLHDLYRIILQLKKELPKNAELAVHFARVINVQQENFHKEIRESQKTIIKCYERMLSFYRDTSRVARVISERISLSVEDVVNVISRCILIEGQCETEETTIGSQKKGLDGVHKKNSESMAQPTKISECPPKQQVNNSAVCFPPSGLLHVSHRPKMIHRPSGELQKAREPPMWGKNLYSLDPPVKVPSQCYDDHQITRKYKPNVWVQQISSSRPHYRETRLEPLPQSGLNLRPSGIVMQSLFPQNPIESHLGSLTTEFGAGITGQNMRSPHVPRDGLFQQRRLLHESSAMETNSNILPPVSVVLPAAQDNEYNCRMNHELRNNHNSGTSAGVEDSLRSGAYFSVKNLNGPAAEQIVSPSRAQCPSIRLRDQKRLRVKTVEISGIKSTNENPGSQHAQEILDPTIPQKLTMRNCRLQAGPVLDLERETAEKLNPSRPSPQEQKIRTESRNSDRDDSKSRVYVCAQNDCRNPGVRICKGCQSVIYCSETCQLKHWTIKHKSECCQLKALRG